MTEEVPETKKPTMIFIIVGLLVLAGIILFLLFGLKGKPPERETTVEYNYFKFEEIGGLWQTTIQLQNQVYEGAFRFNPKQVEDVYISGDFSGFKSSPIYITFDPDAEESQFKYLALASSELSLHIIRGLNFTAAGACTKNETEACLERPIVTCDDVDKSVIYLKAEAPTQITLNEHCVTVSGLEMDLLKSVDRLLFQWYKIMR
jgi:hypothetical protein